MIIDKLVALLSYELGPNSEAEKKKYEEGLEDVTSQIGKMATIAQRGALALAGLGAGFVFAATKTAEGVDELGKFTQATGLAFDEVQRLIFAGGIYGATQDQIVSSLDNVQQKLAEFRRGQGDFTLLGQIGVSTEGVDAIGFIERLSERFQDFTAQQAQEFGRKLGIDRDVVNLLHAGGDELQRLKMEADELGLVLGADVAANSADFIDAQFRLQSVLSSVQATVTSGIIPALTDFLNIIVEWIKENRELIESGINVFLNGMLKVFKALGFAISFLVGIWRDFVTIVGSLERALIAVGIAATALNAKVLLIPVLVGAAIAAVLLVIEDLFRFLSDPEALTITGLLVDSFAKLGDELFRNNELARSLFEILFKAFDLVKGVGEALGNTVGKFVIDTENEGLLGAAGNFAGDAVEGAGNLLSDGFGFVSGAVSNFFGGGDTTQTTNTNGSLQVEVNVNGNVDAQQVGEGIGTGLIREAGNAGLTAQNPVAGGQ